MSGEESWRPHWGNHYDSWDKDVFLRPVLARLEQEKKIGRVVVDVGSGAHPASAYLHGDCKIITVDIVGTEVDDVNYQHIKFDIEKAIDTQAFGTKKAVRKVSKFLEIDPRTESDKKQVDTMIFSEVLNYVDFERVVGAGAVYIKEGGRLIIVNMPDRGFHKLFSSKGLKTNADLYRVLEKEGFEIESEQPLGEGEKYTDKELMVFVAVKKSKQTAVESVA